jgi:hypothetical protein
MGLLMFVLWPPLLRLFPGKGKVPIDAIAVPDRISEDRSSDFGQKSRYIKRG